MIGYYIHENYVINGILTSPGVQKKVEEQIKVISTEHEVRELSIQPLPSTVKNKILRRLPAGSRIYDWNGVLDRIVSPDFVYIRKPMFDYGTDAFLRELRKKYPDAKIVMEIPTYPYDREITAHIRDYPLYLKDVFYRKRLHKYLDRIVTYYTDDPTIFGVPTIRIQNGLNVEEHPIRKAKTDLSEIHLIAVACFQRAHGYERIIKGLAEYYKASGTRKIVLDMIGNGDEMKLYTALTESLGMQDHVVFWGPKYGHELTKMFDLADIGLAPFGFYKHGIDVSSALKLREYLARGLPVAAGSKQDIFTEETFPYYVEFSNDDTVVDMNRMVDFFDRIYRGTESYAEVIHNTREYAENHVAWNKTFIPVMEYLRMINR